jgi:hypothetical protein
VPDRVRGCFGNRVVCLHGADARASNGASSGIADLAGDIGRCSNGTKQQRDDKSKLYETEFLHDILPHWGGTPKRLSTHRRASHIQTAWGFKHTPRGALGGEIIRRAVMRYARLAERGQSRRTALGAGSCAKDAMRDFGLRGERWLVDDAFSERTRRERIELNPMGHWNQLWKQRTRRGYGRQGGFRCGLLAHLHHAAAMLSVAAAACRKTRLMVGRE